MAVADIMSNTIALSNLFFMSAPLTMTEFAVFGTFDGALLGMLLRRQVTAMCPALLLGLPAGRAAVVAAKGIGAMCSGRVLRRLRNTLLRSLMFFTRWSAVPLYGLRPGVISAVVVAL